MPEVRDRDLLDLAQALQGWELVPMTVCFRVGRL